MVEHTAWLPFKCLWWWSILSGSACLLPCQSCTFAAVLSWRFFFNFCMTLWLAIRWPTYCILLMIMSLPPAIGPTLGTNFRLSWDFKLSPSEGVASHMLGLQRQTETKAIDVVRWIFIVLDQGMVQKTLTYNSTWVEGKEGRKLYKKMNILWGNDEWHLSNKTWDIKLN